jgi:hypothetical protein
MVLFAILAHLVSPGLPVEDREPGVGGEMGVGAAPPPACQRIGVVEVQLGGEDIESLQNIADSRCTYLRDSLLGLC